MTAEETKQLQEDLKQTRAELRKVRERQALNDASVAIAGYYKTVRVNEGVQQRVTGRVLAGNIPLTEAGDLDHKKLTEFVEAETKDELEYLSRVSGGRIVAGMGSVAPPSQPTKEEQAAQHKAVEAELERSASLYGFGGKEHSVGRRILNEGASAFDFTYNARNDGATVRAGTGSLPLEA